MSDSAWARNPPRVAVLSWGQELYSSSAHGVERVGLEKVHATVLDLPPLLRSLPSIPRCSCRRGSSPAGETASSAGLTLATCGLLLADLRAVRDVPTAGLTNRQAGKWCASLSV
eukprot:768305-Hanusia_phi.AAC.6